ncbi:hypothetical protein V865_001981 [Kwoniella europaea PYCC6329]|uniref:Uncharacterized protein n=1 Tax=Kwoniella europaea PYCC6329 TaxID=1423913 RepID=A0AAX4KEX0_9TREE
MAFSSLADELAGAFENDPSLDQGEGLGLGQSLADELELDYELEQGHDHGIKEQGEIHRLEDEIQHPSTPPSRNGNLSKTTTPPRDDAGRRTAKTSYEPTNLDDISPNRGIDLDLELELELEYGQNHSFSSQPHFQDEDSYNYQYEQDHLDNLPTTASPVRVRGIQNKSSTRSLRVNPRSSVRSLRALNGNEKEEGIQEALIILSEGISANSRLLNFLRQIKHHHQEGEEEIEIRLQRHLNRMNEVERTRDEWIRDLGIWSREVGLGGLEGNGRLGDGDDKLIDVSEEDEEDEEGESLGWTGESIVDDNDHLFEGEEISKNPQVTVFHEKDHINPHDSLCLDEDGHDSSAAYSSDQSPLSPITPLKHHQPAQDLPKLIMAIQKDTDILLLSLRNLQDTIHTTTSFHTSLARMMKGIRSSIDSHREREHVEEQARRKIEEWEAERLKIGLTRNNTGGGEEGWTTKEKLDKECREFEDVLEWYGDRLKGLKEGTRRVAIAA